MSETTAPPARRLRRWTSGTALILIAPLMAVETVFDPALTGTGEVMYAAATERAGALAVSGLLLLLIGMLMIPAATAIVHLARDRGAGLANLGAVTAVLAFLRFAGIGIFYLFALSLAGGDRAEMVAYVERINAGPVFGVLGLVLALGAHLSLVVLPWAAWRAGLVATWAPVLATVVVVAHFFVPVHLVVEFVTFAAFTAVLGSLGLRILRMSDAEWDGVPRFAARPEPVRG